MCLLKNILERDSLSFLKNQRIILSYSGTQYPSVKCFSQILFLSLFLGETLVRPGRWKLSVIFHKHQFFSNGFNLSEKTALCLFLMHWVVSCIWRDDFLIFSENPWTDADCKFICLERITFRHLQLHKLSVASRADIFPFCCLNCLAWCPRVILQTSV